MMFSKSFGYALRSLLYVAERRDEGGRIQMQEIAENLGIPKPFLSKVMKWLAREGILKSTKGPFGGFSLNKGTLNTSLAKLAEITHDYPVPDACILHLGKCNAQDPCVMHVEMES